MKRYIVATLICALSALTLTGCGDGGGGGTTPTTPAATKATTKVYLFGALSSNSKIATVQTTMIVPNGIMVNYSSPPGATSGIFPLRRGVAVPSGPVQVSAADISGTFDIASRKLNIYLFNNPTNPVLLKSSSSGIGEEIATLNLTLASPGVQPLIPALDKLVMVSQDRGGNSVNYLSGCSANFVTAYQ